MTPPKETQDTGSRPKKQIKKSIMTRVRWLYAAFALVGVAIFAMILLTQYGPNGKVLRNSTDYICYKTLPVKASRGNIYSHDGMILATDSPSYSIYLDFTRVDTLTFNGNYRALADSLHSLLPRYSKAYFENRLLEIWQVAHSNKSGRMNQQLFRDKVNQLELDRMNNFPIFRLGRLGGGFKYEKDPDRFKPYDNLASRTIGRPMKVTGPEGRQDTVRALGLEAAFDDRLRGYDGRNRYVHLFRDVWVPVQDKENVEVKNGKSIITTLDVDLQDIAETELKNQMLKHSALAGTAIIMEVETGEIRAVSNLTRHGSDVYDDENHAVSMMTEPGSTFKLVSLMALLDEAGYDINMKVDCTESGRYKYQPKNRTRTYDVVDSHPVGKTTLRGVMEESSNIGFVKVIDGEYRDNPERFVNYVKNLGFDERINMQLVGGRKPIIKDPARPRETGWDVLSLMKMAYGYAIEVAPIHTLMLYNAVANEGTMVAPRLVTAVLDEGEVVEEFPVQVLNDSICSPQTLAIVKSTLEGVVLRGTGAALKNPNYSVAGKTGTAQLVFPGGGYQDSKGGRSYLATFVGYFPVEKPKYSCIVAIRTYNGPGNRNAYYGAQLALPAFKAIADKVNTVLTDRKMPFERDENPGAAPLKTGNPEELKVVAEKLNVPDTASGGYWPSDTVALNHDEDALIMPSVTGMGLKDAIYLLERIGLAVEFHGTGKVSKQSVEAGKEVSRGQKVNLTLVPAEKPTRPADTRPRS